MGARKLAERRITIPYKPREVFMPFHDRTQRWACLVAHRRAGKTVAAVNDLIRAAITCTTRNPLFGYVAPFRSQAKDISWNYLKWYSKEIANDVNESELRIDLINGARIRLFGADNSDAMRGLGFDGVFMDEFGDFKPSVFGAVIRPALSDKQGWAVFAGTPKGKNQFWEIFDKAQSSPDEWFCARLPASQTHILPQEELNALKRQMTEDQYLQEYETSFEAAILGAFYGREMRELAEQGRIREVLYDPSLPCFTAWDIGHTDDTSIWWFQMIRSEIHLIDYVSASGGGPDHFGDLVAKRKIPCVNGKSVTPHYEKHFLPHDAKASTFASNGLTTVEQLVPHLGFGKLAVLPLMDKLEGINAARMTLPRCWFDATRCKEGIEALRQYEREYDEDAKTFRQAPKHNWASHGADAFRYLATSWKEQGPNLRLIHPERALVVGPGNEATLEDMWAAAKTEQKRRRI